jgi:hypothetical protein
MTVGKTITALITSWLLVTATHAYAETLLRVATPGALTGALPIYLGAKKAIQELNSDS